MSPWSQRKCNSSSGRCSARRREGWAARGPWLAVSRTTYTCDARSPRPSRSPRWRSRSRAPALVALVRAAQWFAGSAATASSRCLLTAYPLWRHTCASRQFTIGSAASSLAGSKPLAWAPAKAGAAMIASGFNPSSSRPAPSRPAPSRPAPSHPAASHFEVSHCAPSHPPIAPPTLACVKDGCSRDCLVYRHGRNDDRGRWADLER